MCLWSNSKTVLAMLQKGEILLRSSTSNGLCYVCTVYNNVSIITDTTIAFAAWEKVMKRFLLGMALNVKWFKPFLWITRGHSEWFIEHTNQFLTIATLHSLMSSCFVPLVHRWIMCLFLAPSQCYLFFRDVCKPFRHSLPSLSYPWLQLALNSCRYSWGMAPCPQADSYWLDESWYWWWSNPLPITLCHILWCTGECSVSPQMDLLNLSTMSDCVCAQPESGVTWCPC